MILRLFLSLIAILFPWLILLLDDNPTGAAIALVMQASVLGWPFAAVWALRIQREKRKAQLEEKKRKAKQAQNKTEKQEETQQ